MDDKKLAPIGARPVRPANKGYGDAGASYAKKALKGFLASSGSPREDIDANNYTMRQRARMLYMAAPVATSAIKANRTNIVGAGLKLKSRIDRVTLGLSPEQAAEWQRHTEREFAIWANNKRNCDAIGVNNFYKAQGLVLSSGMLSGDVIVLLKHKDPTDLNPYGLRFHIVEADRIATPTEAMAGATFFANATEGTTKDGNKVYDGIEVDKDGLIVAYHIRNTYPRQQTAELTEWVRVEAYGEKTGLPNVLHVMESERAEQYRGVSYLAQVIEPLLQMRRYTDSELTAAVVESFFTAFIKTEASPDAMPFNEVGGEGVPEVSSDPNDYEMGPGTINVLKPGEDVTFGDPTRPAGGFDGFVTSICKQVGAALEIPADLLLKSFDASYSASRAALLEAWKAFKMRREWFVDDFCRPLYEVWLSEAIARGRITAPGFFSDPAIREAWLGSEWTGPAQGQLDPVKEITAEQLACTNGFSTREQSTIRLNGGSYEANVEQLAEENALLEKATIKESADPVDGFVDALIPKIVAKLQAEGGDPHEKKDPTD
jgi:lambda family phage portal protein